MHYIQRMVLKSTGKMIDISKMQKDASFKPYFVLSKIFIYFLKIFKAKFDEKKVNERFTLFLVALKQIDNDMDYGKSDGKEFLDMFMKPVNQGRLSYLLWSTVAEEVGSRRFKMKKSLITLFKAVVNQKKSKNMKHYIDSLINVGEFSALVMLEIVEDLVTYRDYKFRSFYLKMGRAGQLLDASCDIEEDTKRGELSFKIPFFQKLWLHIVATVYAIGIFLRYPFVILEAPGFIKLLKKGNY